MYGQSDFLQSAPPGVMPSFTGANNGAGSTFKNYELLGGAPVVPQTVSLFQGPPGGAAASMLGSPQAQIQLTSSSRKHKSCTIKHILKLSWHLALKHKH